MKRVLWLIIVLGVLIVALLGSTGGPALIAPVSAAARYYVGPVSCHAAAPAVAAQWVSNREKARAVAERYHLEALVFLWQINQESGFNPQAVSSAGAIGIAQFLPTTAAGMQPPVNPWDVDSALDGAMRLDLRELRAYWPRSLSLAQHFGGNRNVYVWGLALAAYNAGGGRSMPRFAGRIRWAGLMPGPG